MSVVPSPGTYLILSRGCSAGSESGIQPRVNYVSKISSAFGTRYIFSYVPGTSYPFMPVATYHSTVRWQSEHQLGHHYRNATIPCVKEARWGRHEAQDSIVLSMSNDLLCSGAQHDTHTHTSAAGYPMDDCNVIDIGLRVIKRCGMYSKEYKN